MPEVSFDESTIQYSKQKFQKALNQDFKLATMEGGTIALKLKAIVDSAYPNPKFDGFSLIFAAPEGRAPLPDNTYPFENETLGKGVMHISACPTDSSDPNEYEYEAVFNLKK